MSQERFHVKWMRLHCCTDSGNYGGRSTIESALVLDLNGLLPKGVVGQSRTSGVTIVWSNTAGFTRR